MAVDNTHLILRIETTTPIELNDFVAAFVGFGNQFERFHDGEHPTEQGNSRFYVRRLEERVALGGEAIAISGR